MPDDSEHRDSEERGRGRERGRDRRERERKHQQRDAGKQTETKSTPSHAKTVRSAIINYKNPDLNYGLDLDLLAIQSDMVCEN